MVKGEGKQARLTLLDDTPHGARERGPHSEPAVVENLHGNFETVPGVAQDILHRDGSVLEVDL